jgi:hypothetical protein
MWIVPDGYPLDINPALYGGTAAVRLELERHPRPDYNWMGFQDGAEPDLLYSTILQ